MRDACIDGTGKVRAERLRRFEKIRRTVVPNRHLGHDRFEVFRPPVCQTEHIGVRKDPVEILRIVVHQKFDAVQLRPFDERAESLQASQHAGAVIRRPQHEFDADEDDEGTERALPEQAGNEILRDRKRGSADDRREDNKDAEEAAGIFRGPAGRIDKVSVVCKHFLQFALRTRIRTRERTGHFFQTHLVAAFEQSVKKRLLIARRAAGYVLQLGERYFIWDFPLFFRIVVFDCVDLQIALRSKPHHQGYHIFSLEFLVVEVARLCGRDVVRRIEFHGLYRPAVFAVAHEQRNDGKRRGADRRHDAIDPGRIASRASPVSFGQHDAGCNAFPGIDGSGHMSLDRRAVYRIDRPGRIVVSDGSGNDLQLALVECLRHVDRKADLLYGRLPVHGDDVPVQLVHIVQIVFVHEHVVFQRVRVPAGDRFIGRTDPDRNVIRIRTLFDLLAFALEVLQLIQHLRPDQLVVLHKPDGSVSPDIAVDAVGRGFKIHGDDLRHMHRGILFHVQRRVEALRRIVDRKRRHRLQGDEQQAKKARKNVP